MLGRDLPTTGKHPFEDETYYNYFITCVELVGGMVLVFGSEVSGFLVAILLRTVFSSTTAAFLNATGTPSKDLNEK